MKLYTTVIVVFVVLLGTSKCLVEGDNAIEGGLFDTNEAEDELDYKAILQSEMEWKEDDDNKKCDDMSLLPAAALDLQRTGRSTYTSSQYGGYGGTWFSDSAYETYGPITILRVWGAGFVDAIQVTYGVHTAPKHGGRGGTRHTFYLGQGEKITQVTISAGGYVDRIGFVTNRGRILGEVGGRGGTHHVLRPPYSTCYLSSVEGRGAGYIDMFRFRWHC
ncbi:uncharacterized protein LOC144875829 isoform X2 [Branchiostoma floridae x Branchiostoma japonicum]